MRGRRRSSRVPPSPKIQLQGLSLLWNDTLNGSERMVGWEKKKSSIYYMHLHHVAVSHRQGVQWKKLQKSSLSERAQSVLQRRHWSKTRSGWTVKIANLKCGQQEVTNLQQTISDIPQNLNNINTEHFNFPMRDSPASEATLAYNRKSGEDVSSCLASNRCAQTVQTAVSPRLPMQHSRIAEV